MGYLSDCSDCEEIVKRFLNELRIDIEELVELPLGKDTRHHEPEINHVNAYKISTAVYGLLWAKRFGIEKCTAPGKSGFYLKSASNICYYSGETLNSYKTVFGGSKLDALKEKVFLRGNYHTIANFMPFPVVTYGRKIRSLNQWKGIGGIGGIGDFMDLFLMLVKVFFDNGMKHGWTNCIQEKYLPDNNDLKAWKIEAWKTGTEKVFNANKETYFEKFADFSDYCKSNYLSMYRNNEGDIDSFIPFSENHRIYKPFPSGAEREEAAIKYVEWMLTKKKERAKDMAVELSKII